jgi:hypothetical protein
MSEAAIIGHSGLVDVAADVRITIDDEFASLIPPLAADERKELEASLVEHGGARDPLIVWDRGDAVPPILLDGHNRVEICWRLGLPYTVKGIRFESKEQALAWMRRNQLGRRNLSRNAFMLMLGELYNRMNVAGRWHPSRKGRRSSEIAIDHGVTEKTVRRAGKFKAAAEKLGVAEEIASGKIKATVDSVIAVAATLPARPSKRDIDAAVHGGLHRVAVRPKRDSRVRPSQTWLVPSEPADCLKAIRFYAKTFAVQATESMDALVHTLTELLDQHRPRA